VVTHKIFDAFKLAHRYMFLKNGTIIFDGQKEKLIYSSIPEIQIFLSELNPRSKGPSPIDVGEKNV
jgi:phospholipid/cholesterol/gamma-HCH transport system ATP-binding protein